MHLKALGGMVIRSGACRSWPASMSDCPHKCNASHLERPRDNSRMVGKPYLGITSRLPVTRKQGAALPGERLANLPPLYL